MRGIQGLGLGFRKLFFWGFKVARHRDQGRGVQGIGCGRIEFETCGRARTHELRLVAALEALRVESPAAAEALARRRLVVDQRELRVVVGGEEVEHGGHPPSPLVCVVPIAPIFAIPRLVPIRRCLFQPFVPRSEPRNARGRGARGGEERRAGGDTTEVEGGWGVSEDHGTGARAKISSQNSARKGAACVDR